MERNRRTSIIVVGGALAVASIGYGLGTQADDGTAVAGGDDRSAARGVAFAHTPALAFGGLADTLGVDTDQLEDALRDFHEREHAEHRKEFATTLANALDVPVKKVGAALDSVHDRLEVRFEQPMERGDVRPAERPRFRHAWFPLRQLAAELDVTRAELRSALREARPERAVMENRFEQHQQELAKFLAERFDIDVDEVDDALAELPRPAPHPHPGRPGPGGPGAFGPAR